MIAHFLPFGFGFETVSELQKAHGIVVGGALALNC